jgi:hypothetical protein
MRAEHARGISYILVLLFVGLGWVAPAAAQNPTARNHIQYAKPQQIGVVDNPEILESSGIARSIVNHGAFWTHNDSGDTPRIFLIGRDGETLAEATIENAAAVDWEDIASFRRGEDGFLLIGDVGDNAAARERSILYIVPEPRIERGDETLKLSLIPSSTLHFTYEDGPHNCESIGVDMTDNAIYLVSKKGGTTCKAYRLPLPERQSAEPAVAKAIAVLTIPATTAMDISPDGSRAVVLTYGHAREYMRRAGEPWSKAVSRKGRIIVMPRRQQGESICYGEDGKTLYLTSEGETQPLWEVPPIPGEK